MSLLPRSQVVLGGCNVVRVWRTDLHLSATRTPRKDNSIMEIVMFLHVKHLSSPVPASSRVRRNGTMRTEEMPSWKIMDSKKSLYPVSVPGSRRRLVNRYLGFANAALRNCRWWWLNDATDFRWRHKIRNEQRIYENICNVTVWIYLCAS